MTSMPRIQNRPALAAGALAVLSAIVVAWLCPQHLHAQSNNGATYSAAQATAGSTAYAQNCASCHGPNTDDGEFAPPLKGMAFMQKYAGKPDRNGSRRP